MEKAEAERQSWFEAFLPLYERAAHIIDRIADLGMLTSGELPVSPYAIAESNLTLQPILEATRKIHKPKEKELLAIQQEFQLSLSSCIRAVEAAVKYIELEERGTYNSAVLNTIINSLVLAHDYIESASDKLIALRMNGQNTKPWFEQASADK